MEKEFETLLSYIDYASLNNKENVDEVYKAWECIKAENEKLKAELQQSATKCNKLRYALARLRWEHAHQMETMIDLRYTIRPSSWRFYYKSKTYWYNKWQELKKELKEK